MTDCSQPHLISCRLSPNLPYSKCIMDKILGPEDFRTVQIAVQRSSISNGNPHRQIKRWCAGHKAKKRQIVLATVPSAAYSELV